MSSDWLRLEVADAIRRHGAGRAIFSLRSGSKSTDIDIYCLVDNHSFVDMHVDAHGRWTEIFADTRDTLRWKIENYDEIVLSILASFEFAFGNRGEHATWRRKALQTRTHYALPEYRRKKLQYRVITLGSKLLGTKAVTDGDATKLLVGAIAYPLLQLLLSANGVCPGSPKAWLAQAKDGIPAQDYRLLLRVIRHGDLEALRRLVDGYTGDLHGLSIDRSGEPTLTTIV
ncbi:MAG TPA: hypothetical protein VF846_20060 [Thermoanaerobaculia bacterium]